MRLNKEAGSEVQNKSAVQITLIDSNQTIKDLWLPQKAEGKFRFSRDGADSWYDFFCIEGKNDEWYIVCTEYARIQNFPAAQDRATLLPIGRFVTILHDGQEYTLYAEEITAENNVYHNYLIKNGSRITIGRADGNDIQYVMNCVSAEHADLWWKGNHWMVTDNDSLNGTYVNGRRIHEVSVFPGDTIYIAGLRIIIGFAFLSMNVSGRAVSLNAQAFSPYLPKAEACSTREFREETAQENFFNRAPRRRIPMSFEPIQIEAPPMSMRSEQMPFLLRMGRSAVMGGRALVAGQITSVLSSFLFPLLTSRYSEKERKDYEEKRSSMYKQYLAEKELEIENERAKELRVLNHNYSALNSVLTYPISGERLWERQSSDDDFLTLRVGSGHLPLQAEIQFPERHFEIEEDELETQMYALAEKDIYLEDAPILSSFIDDYVCGVLGERNLILSFVRNIILNLTILHSYDEVKTIFLINPSELKLFDYIRYIPHAWNNQRSFRFIATDINEAYKIGEYLKQELEADIDNPKGIKDSLKKRPYYFVFALDKHIYDSLELLKSILQVESNIGVTVLAAFDELPKECTKIFQMNKNGRNEIIHLKQLEQENDGFFLDSCDTGKCLTAMEKLANTSLKIVSQNNALPKMVTFLEMFDAGHLEHLNVAERWKHSNPAKSLAAPVGIGIDGSMLNLDLHEKFQGPHGLIAGMTGSGKSEFLITYILSLAVNYRPDEVAFLLIDYKGGGLADAFDGRATGARLPHLMGTVTNLDGSAIQRSLLTLDSECKRRQRVFSSAKEKLRVATMDIYSYQKAYRNGDVSESMPHLFIISDEFAELKQQQPEFMERLISIARIGRSLGIHLILATQKPSGVVNDQIRSNTKFRVCLKVQDRSDSMDMLKRPEAAEIIETGRFYLQVGYNEYFALGQSAWCGAQYEPQEKVVVKRDEAVYFLDDLGQTSLKIAPKVQSQSTGKSQLVEIVQHLSEVAKRENYQPHSLWTDPLPDIIDLNEHINKIADSSCIAAGIGMIDNPENQEQFPLVFNFQHCQNLMIVGEAGSGKTTLIQSILYALAKSYSPDDFQCYVLDYSSKLLKIFSALPHCGAVLTEDSSELEAFFDLLAEIVSERKKIYADLEVDNFDDARLKKKLPLVLVVIDGFSGLSGSKEGTIYLQRIQPDLRENTKYGIKYIIASTHLNEVNSRIRQEIGDCICLHMSDKYAYGEALSCRVSYLPPETPGRGLYKLGDVPLELQCFIYCVSEENPQTLKKSLLDICKRTDTNTVAKRLPSIPESETYIDFSQKFSPKRIPLGYAMKTGKPVAMPFRQFCGLSLYFGNETGIQPVWDNFLYAAEKNKMSIIAVRKKNGSILHHCSCYEMINIFECENEKLVDLWKMLSKLLLDRKAIASQYIATSGIKPNSKENMDKIFEFVRENTEPALLLIESFEDFCGENDDSSEKVFDKIFRMSWQYNLFVIGGFYPDTNTNIQFQTLFKALNIGGNYMLFGGHTANQPFDINDLRVTQVKEKLPYNYCVMQYKKQLHELIMPCGELMEEELNEDEKSIF